MQSPNKLGKIHEDGDGAEPDFADDTTKSSSLHASGLKMHKMTSEDWREEKDKMIADMTPAMIRD